MRTNHQTWGAGISQAAARKGGAGLAVLLGSLVALSGCGAGGEEAGAAEPTSQASALHHAPGPVVSDFSHPPSLPHGVAGDRDLVFVTLPLAGGVQVVDRSNGQQVAMLPAPAAGFKLPFALRVPREGHLVVLDSGGFPSPFAPAIPVVYDYEYRNDCHGFSASITRSVSFAGLPLVFAEDVEVVNDDLYVVSESVIGGLWLIDHAGNISPGVVPDNPGAPLAQLGGCPIPEIDVGGIPFNIGFAPGVGTMAHHGDSLYFGSSCLGGLYRIPIHSLRAGSSPSARANDIETVSARPANTYETLHGLAMDPSDPSGRHVVAGDPFHLQLLRIDVRDGSREVLANDPVLFDFPVAVQALPGSHGETSVIVSSDQEQRFAAFNPGIPQDEFLLPFHLTEVTFRSH